MSQLANLSSVHLPDNALVDWGEPHFQKDPDTWVVDLEFHALPQGWVRICFFGTEEQVRKISGGYQAPEEVAADPAQLDALEEATPEPRPMTDLGAQVFELGNALNKIGAVASW